MNRLLRVLLSAAWAIRIAGSLSAAPFERWFEHTLQDGRTVKIRGAGDEYSAAFEDAAGYTILWDAPAGVYRYAVRDAQSGALLPSALILGSADPAEIAQTVSKPHLRDTSETRREAIRARIAADPTREAREARWKAIRQATAVREKAAAEGSLKAPPFSPTIGTVTGLTLLIDFPILDAGGNVTNTLAQTAHPAITGEVLNQFINGENFTSFGNAGSVRKYYEDVSNGRLCVTNIVMGYVLAPRPRSHYENNSVDNGTNARILIGDIFTALKARPDFSTVIYPQLQKISRSGDYFKALNIFFAGPSGSVWSYGLWAHKWVLEPEQFNLLPVTVDGATRYFYTYQISPITSNPEIGTFCHENGHMVCAFPDIYDYGYDSVGGAGYYCLMGSGGDTGNPVRVCAYLRAAAGWVTPQAIPRTGAGTLAVTAGADAADSVWKWANPANANEYFLIENRKKINRDSQISGGGICIWHVDEAGDRDNQSRGYNFNNENYEVGCEQADGLFHFENDALSNDSLDFWFAGNTAGFFQNAFNDLTTPNARWWSGAASGLSLSGFSEKGSSMTFSHGPAAASVSLEEAVDWPGAFTSGVGVAWVGERFPEFAADGNDYARSGIIRDYQDSVLSMTLTGPGELSFHWNVSSEQDYDVFTFTENGTERIRASGTRGTWQRAAVVVPDSEPRTFVWRYAKDGSHFDGMDCAMLDRLVWRDWDAVQKPLIEDVTAFSENSRTIAAAFLLPRAGYDATSVLVTMEISRHEDFSTLDAAASATWSANEPDAVKTLTATGAFTSGIPYFVRLVARNNLGKTDVSEAVSVFCTVSLAESLGASTRFFGTGGTQPWAVTQGIGHTGSQAWFAQSGAIANNQHSEIETAVIGKGTLSFRWACSSEEDYDELLFIQDGEVKAFISGEADWRPVTISVNTEGLHRFVWRYEKDSSESAGADAGYLAAFKWVPMGAPVFDLLFVSAAADRVTVRADVQTLGTAAASGTLMLTCSQAQATKQLSAAGSHDLTLTGLEPNTVYTVSGVLVNNLGVMMQHEQPLIVMTASSALAAPSIGLPGGGNPLGFAVGTGGVETFTVAITDPATGVYYTPFMAATPGGAYTAGAASTLASGEASLILAVPTQGAPRLFVKVVASSTPFAAGDPLP